jgi:hypothetical protein
VSKIKKVTIKEMGSIIKYGSDICPRKMRLVRFITKGGNIRDAISCGEICERLKVDEEILVTRTISPSKIKFNNYIVLERVNQ